MLAGIKELGLLSVDDTDHSITATDVKEAAERIADKYVDLQMPDIRETGKLRYCTSTSSDQRYKFTKINFVST